MTVLELKGISYYAQSGLIESFSGPKSMFLNFSLNLLKKLFDGRYQKVVISDCFDGKFMLCLKRGK